MPYLPQLIPVRIPEARAKTYFRQLASAVAYLHEHSISERPPSTPIPHSPLSLAHNDLKPTNIMLTHRDIPVLVDFGFAQKWDPTTFKTSHHALAELSGQAIGNVPFMSRISWGTPEYLEPPVGPPRSLEGL